jgi:hypothetical protein
MFGEVAKSYFESSIPNSSISRAVPTGVRTVWQNRAPNFWGLIILSQCVNAGWD